MINKDTTKFFPTFLFSSYHGALCYYFYALSGFLSDAFLFLHDASEPKTTETGMHWACGVSAVLYGTISAVFYNRHMFAHILRLLAEREERTRRGEESEGKGGGLLADEFVGCSG